MGEHVCPYFRMRSECHFLEMSGERWLLHVMDVDGEEDIMVVTMRVSADWERSFADFASLLREKSSLHPGANVCPDCRPEDRGLWRSLFWEWLESAYSSMSSPPEVVGDEDVPGPVRLALESLVCGEDEDPRRLN